MPVSLTRRVGRSCDNKNILISSDGGDSGSNRCKRGYGGACGKVCWGLRLVGVWSEAVGFALVRLVGIWFQHL